MTDPVSVLGISGIAGSLGIFLGHYIGARKMDEHWRRNVALAKRIAIQERKG